MADVNSNSGVIQVHHIIPREVFNKLGKKLTDLMGDLQRQDNLIMLFTEETDAAKMAGLIQQSDGFGDVPLGGVRHNGYHKSYNKVRGCPR